MKKSRDLKIIYFDDLMPRIQIRTKKVSELYKNAFLENDEIEMSEYCRNTTSWD